MDGPGWGVSPTPHSKWTSPSAHRVQAAGTVPRSRAWHGCGDFEGRSSLRTWRRLIATRARLKALELLEPLRPGSRFTGHARVCAST
ncbi:hypothetical protein ETD86_37215 [Nonomuraea turkmeniaca]|uniref:Uncharacterized protein n=1 Tax=Nonomuraea turkmeniaca TaxID=103838 RepID=A0A5S4F537_9ACTN|nr:hypothetical protein ETD86_37215 [Nonomuraea turkmeniaca]